MDGSSVNKKSIAMLACAVGILICGVSIFLTSRPVPPPTVEGGPQARTDDEPELVNHPDPTAFTQRH